MKTNRKIFYLLFLTGSSLFMACKKGDLPDVPAKVLQVNFRAADSTLYDSSDFTTNIVGDSIKVVLPGTTDITSVITDIHLDGATVSPKPGSRQNFTKPVDYTITTKDGTKIYHVAVKLNKLKNIIYFGGGDNALYALTTRGRLAWKYISDSGFSYSEPVLVNGTIYITNEGGKLLAIDPALGKLKWAFSSASTSITTPAVANGIVYFGSDDHFVYAVDATTGALKWKYQTQGNVDSSPAVVNGILYIGSGDYNLYAFDALTGSVKWKYNTGNIITESSPVVSNNVVFIGDRNGYLNAVDATSGALKWKFSTDGISMEQGRIVVQNKVIYFTSWYKFGDNTKPGSLYAVNEADGTLVWKSLAGKGFSSGPTWADGKLYVNADDGNIYAVDATSGSILWSKNIYANGAIPSIANGTVYPGGGGSRYFYSFDATSGTGGWTYPLTNSINTSKPCIIDNSGNVIL